MSLRDRSLSWLQDGFAVSADGRIDLYALAARVHTHPTALTDAIRHHFDVLTNPNGTLTWLPRADQIEQDAIAA